MHRVPYASGIGSIANVIIFTILKFFKCLAHLEGNGQESVLTKIIKQLSKDNPKFDEDWLLVSSWKHGINGPYWHYDE